MSTCLEPVLNPGRRGGKPATNRLSYGAARVAVFFYTETLIENKIRGSVSQRVIWDIFNPNAVLFHFSVLIAMKIYSALIYSFHSRMLPFHHYSVATSIFFRI
jgi:hypothetical protein